MEEQGKRAKSKGEGDEYHSSSRLMVMTSINREMVIFFEMTCDEWLRRLEGDVSYHASSMQRSGFIDRHHGWYRPEPDVFATRASSIDTATSSRPICS